MTYYDRVCIAEDFKDSEGKWVKSFPSEFVYYNTRAWTVWKGLQGRCKVGGIMQERQPTFMGNVNNFENFQDFAGWCQTQYGYNNKEGNGKYWQLDKDIIKPLNKTYSPNFCCFVPQRLNSALLFKSASRGELPLGVFLDKRRGHFIARCRGLDSKVIWLGSFGDKMTAHRAWQLENISN